MNSTFLLRTSFCAAALLVSSLPTFAQPVIDYVSQISTGLAAPIDIVHAGDGSNRLFVVQRSGTIRVYNQALTTGSDYLTVTGISTTGEGGLLSAAFHPQYETNGLVFVYYSLPNNSLEIARYTVDATNPNLANPASKVVLLNIPHPSFTNHNGGKLNFGADGMLYLGTGDGGGSGDPNQNAQNGSSLLGKMLRLNVTTTTTAPYYTIPTDNPYITDPNVADEIYAIGLRNPWRWSFDRTTNDMWIADVGEGAIEEINYRPAAAPASLNYGWRCYEGAQAYNTSGCLPASNYTPPIFGYGHNNANGGFSVTGGYVYRGSEFPALVGHYIFADYVSGNHWTMTPDGIGGWSVYQQDAGLFPENIVTYGEAEDGTLYAASLSANAVYKVIVTSVLPLKLANFAGDYKDGSSQLSWTTTMEANLSNFEIEYSFDGSKFTLAGNVPAQNEPNGAAYTFQHRLAVNGKVWYRLKMKDRDGSFTYSNIITLSNNTKAENLIYPTLVGDGMLHLQLAEIFNLVEIRNTTGALISQQSLKEEKGLVHINLDARFTPGMYLVTLISNNNRINQKIIVR